MHGDYCMLSKEAILDIMSRASPGRFTDKERVLQAKEADILETLELLCARHGHPLPSNPADSSSFVPQDHPFSGIEKALRRGGTCEACGTHVSLILVTPCAHVVCASCLSADSTACVVPGCGCLYKMQAVNDPSRYFSAPFCAAHSCDDNCSSHPLSSNSVLSQF
jgi:hypothetical protein